MLFTEMHTNTFAKSVLLKHINSLPTGLSNIQAPNHKIAIGVP